MKRISDIITVLQSIVFALCLYPDIYEGLVIVFFILCLARLIIKIGNGSFFLELLHVYAAFTCLFMPLLGYLYFNKITEMGPVWGRVMPVPQEQYFSFTLPAVVIMGWAFFLFRKKNYDDRPPVANMIRRLKRDILILNPSSILTLMVSSLIAYSISSLLPASLQQLNTFLYYSLFASGFYVIFYKNFPGKIYFVVGLISFLIFDALRSGMFTIIVYMSGLFLILILAHRRIQLFQKISILLLALVVVSFIQLFKLDLRRASKKSENITATELATRVVASSQDTKFDALLFPLYQRMNQGYNIALVQRRIPSQVDYLGGEYLALSFVSAFVPRLFWHDKPEAGGRENMRIYTGIILMAWSTNVGPIGEAYGNFGYLGGWIYLLLFSIFLRFAYLKFMSVCYKRPVFFIWLPALFFQTFYVMETDSLQAFNSLIKGAVFMFAMYKLFPSLFPKS